MMQKCLAFMGKHFKSLTKLLKVFEIISKNVIFDFQNFIFLARQFLEQQKSKMPKYLACSKKNLGLAQKIEYDKNHVDGHSLKISNC